MGGEGTRGAALCWDQTPGQGCVQAAWTQTSTSTRVFAEQEMVALNFKDTRSPEPQSGVKMGTLDDKGHGEK